MTTIRFEVDRPSSVRLEVYNVAGERVVTLSDRVFAAGTHALEWSGNSEGGQTVASGVYFYRPTVGKHATTRRIF